MSLTWDDPEPTFITMEHALERMEIPELEMIPARNPINAAPTLEATTSYWRTPMRAFSRFAQLNPEVRKMVWAHAIANDARVIEMRHPDLKILLKDGRQITQPETLTKPRALLLACSESREQLLKSLREVDLGTMDRYLVNFEVDTIYFGPDSYWFHEVLWRPPPLTDEEQAGYNGRDCLKHGWQKRQKWNHWRNGYRSHERGQEAVFDAYQNRDQIRHIRDKYHPLLSSEEYENERKQIRNVAFDLEFWEETSTRHSGGQKDLMSRFPQARAFVLAAGDLGEAYSVQRKDKGTMGGRLEAYQPKLTAYKTTEQPGVIYKGQVELHSGAIQTPLEEEIIDVTAKLGFYPRPVTMYVTRGGEFNGHNSRLIPALIEPQEQIPDNDEDDEADHSYVDSELKADVEEGPADITRIPRLKEMLGLYDDQVYITEQDLQEIKDNLPDDDMAAAFHLYKRAEVPEDEDTEDEMIDLHENEEGADDIAVESAEDMSDAIDVEESNDAAENEVGEKRRDSGVEIAPKGNKTSDKIQCGGKVKRESSPKKVAAEKKPFYNTTAAQGDLMTEIIESKVHYAVLKYRVKWQGQSQHDKIRYPRTEPMFVENEHGRALIAAWHAANPEADDLQTEANCERKAYGSVTKGGVKIAQGPTPSHTPSTTASSSNSSPKRQSEVNNQMYLMSGGSAEALTRAPASAAGLTTPPSSSSSQSIRTV